MHNNIIYNWKWKTNHYYGVENTTRGWTTCDNIILHYNIVIYSSQELGIYYFFCDPNVNGKKLKFFGKGYYIFQKRFSLFGSFKIQMTFQTLILTGPESNLRAPWSLLSERLKYCQVVHNVSCLLLLKLVTKRVKKKWNKEFRYPFCIFHSDAAWQRRKPTSVWMYHRH